MFLVAELFFILFGLLFHSVCHQVTVMCWGNLKSNHMKTACTCRMTVKKSSGMQCQQFLDENFETVFNNIFMRCEACPRVEGSHFLQSVLLFHTNC